MVQRVEHYRPTPYPSGGFSGVLYLGNNSQIVNPFIDPKPKFRTQEFRTLS
jgi:hypothetical protein